MYGNLQSSFAWSTRHNLWHGAEAAIGPNQSRGQHKGERRYKIRIVTHKLM